MNSSFENAKTKLINARFKEAWEEDAFVKELLEAAGPEIKILARWVYEDFKDGYVDPRCTAGLVFYQNEPDVFWEVTEQLIKSPNPDDRDTAITTIRDIPDPRKYPLMQLLLDDPYFYIQIEAIEQLIDQYPAEVLKRLEVLAKSENPRYRESAMEMLKKLS